MRSASMGQMYVRGALDDYVHSVIPALLVLTHEKGQQRMEEVRTELHAHQEEDHDA